MCLTQLDGEKRLLDIYVCRLYVELETNYTLIKKTEN